MKIYIRYLVAVKVKYTRAKTGGSLSRRYSGEFFEIHFSGKVKFNSSYCVLRRGYKYIYIHMPHIQQSLYMEFYTICS